MERLFCSECGKPATWIRNTQFAGKHPFCTQDAEKESDFGKSDSSYFYWKQLPAQGPDACATHMLERNTAVPAVYLLLEQNGKILIGRRCNTGYQDGNYNLPSGHVENGELPKAATIREAKEEINIDLTEEDIEFVHVSYRPPHDETGNRVDLFFHATRWSGKLMNAEPHKCDDLRWVHPRDLPANMTPHVAAIIGYIWDGIRYSEFDADFLKDDGMYRLE